MLWCIVLIIERGIYFIETGSKRKNSYTKRMQNKISTTSFANTSVQEEELKKEVSLIYYDMNRGLWILNFLSAIAPSLGLLGTVTGLIRAFQVMSSTASQINIQDLSKGIWEAMITTAFGMIISIPALFFYRLFRRIIEKRMLRLSFMLEKFF